MFSYSDYFGTLASWNIAQVTDMKWMFAGTTLYSESLLGWNTGNVLNMEYMCTYFFKQGDSDDEIVVV